MKIFFLISLISLCVLMGCRTENSDNSRAYAEGKISGNQIDFLEINVAMISDDKKIAETIPENSGNFVLSGPIFSDAFAITINKKIKSFSASKSGCTLSSDSLNIVVPAGISYITFNEIILE